MTQDRLDYYIDLINAAQDDYDTCFIDGYQWKYGWINRAS